MFDKNKFLRRNEDRIRSACSTHDLADKVIEKISAIEATTEKEYVEKIKPILVVNDVKDITLLVDYVEINNIDVYEEAFRRYE